ncbi:MAG: hypothetical protein R3E89_09995 [Thiolinea sp.]
MRIKGWADELQGARHWPYALTGGPEGAWTSNPTQFDNGYLTMLLDHEWNTTSPAGAKQWKPVDIDEADMPPDAEDPSIKTMPMMTDADMAMKVDPIYREYMEKFRRTPTILPIPLRAPGSS